MDFRHIIKWTPHALGVILFAWMTWISAAVWDMNTDVASLKPEIEHMQKNIEVIEADMKVVQRSLARIEGYLQIPASENNLSPSAADSVSIATRVSETPGP